MWTRRVETSSSGQPRVSPANCAIGVERYVSAGIALGDFALKQLRPEYLAKLIWRIGFAVVTVFVIALLGRIPWVGGFVSLVAILVGVGALVYQARPHQASIAAM